MMRNRQKHYSSYRSIAEEKKNIRLAVTLIIVTVSTGVLLFIFGLPVLAKFASFLIGFRKSSEVVEINDNTPPPPPSFTNLPDSTNETKLEISGNSEPGATIQLFLNNKKSETIVGSGGEFTLILDLNEGKNELYSIAIDQFGNEGQKSKIYEISYDTTTPQIDIEKPQEGSHFFGTKQRQLEIKGKTEPESNLKINDRLVYVEEDGGFTFVTTLSEGENTFTIHSEDKAGNSSEKTLNVAYSS